MTLEERPCRIWGTLLTSGWNTNASSESNDVSHVWIETGKTAPNTPTVIPCNAIWQACAKRVLKAPPLRAAGSETQWRWSEIN